MIKAISLYRLAFSLVLLVAIGAGRAVETRQTPQSPTWTAFSAKWVTRSSPTAPEVAGRIARLADGSLRQEQMDSAGKTTRITIRNAGARRMFVRDAAGEWHSAPLDAAMQFIPPQRAGYERPDRTVEPLVYEGMEALKFTKTDQTSIVTVVPSLSYFAVVREEGGRYERSYDIVVKAPPASDFIPPAGVTPHTYASTAELQRAIR